MSLLLIITIIPGSLILPSCTRFRPPGGIWVCEELGITVDFDDNSVQWASITGKGTIAVDEEVKEIVCGMDPIGGGNILYVEEVSKHPSERTFLYLGTFFNRGANQMTFKIANSGEKYTFVKQE